MDVSVVLICIRSESLALGQTSSHNYEVVVIDEPSTSYRVNDVQCTKVLSLPKFLISQEVPSISEAVLQRLALQTKCKFRRAVEIPLWTNEKNKMGERTRESKKRQRARQMSALVCVPVTVKDGIPLPYARLETLSRAIHICRNDSERVETQTNIMLRRLEEWLLSSHRLSPSFLSTLFLRPSAHSRLKSCSHNPSYGPHNTWNCINVRNSSPGTSSNQGNADIDHEVARGNSARLKMVRYEKFEIFVMNPIFGTGLVYRMKEEAPTYFVRGITELRKASIRTNGSDDWSHKFPLHKAAYAGDSLLIENLVAQGMDPNVADRDSWTPLHYACFYGHLDATRQLLQGGDTNVNCQNKGGATPLHFAALNAHAYLVELLMSHAQINPDIRNVDGQRARDLCKTVPRKDWQVVSKLLETNPAKPKKIQVDFVDLSNLMIPLVDGNDTTAGQILERIEREWNIPKSAVPIFSLWVVSERLSLQLKSDHKVMAHINHKKWKERVTKWATTDICTDGDKPKLLMRRNAQCTLEQEQQAVLNERCLNLLYEEARQLYLKGLYPCNETDSYHLAAIILRIIYGVNHEISEPNLKVILPSHRLLGDRTHLIHQVTFEYMGLKTANITHLQQQFIKKCWTLAVYGSTFFDAEIYMTKPFSAMLPVHFGVNDYGIHLINSETKLLCNTYSLKGLSWEHKPDRHYLEMKARSHGHAFRLRTPQSSHIHMLLTKLCGKDGGSK